MWSVLILCPATLHNDVCTTAYETESKPCRGHTRQSVSRATCRSSRSKWAVKLWFCIQLVALVWTCPISAHHLADDPRCHIGVAHPLVLVGLTCVHKFYVTIQIRCKGRAVGQEHQILGRVYWAGEARTSPSCRTRVHHRTIHTHVVNIEQTTNYRSNLKHSTHHMWCHFPSLYHPYRIPSPRSCSTC
jgi:hypothetical protein